MQEKKKSSLPLVSGKLHEPLRVVVYGPEGVGKSTLVSEFPDPVFLDTEGGTGHLEIERFPKPMRWEDVLSYLDQLSTQEHEFKTLIIDTVDWQERLLIDYICRKANKESIEQFGYGKGYTYVSEEFSRLLRLLESLRERGMHIVFVAHSCIRKFEQPDASGAYDRYELKLSKQCAPLLKEWCDLLLFVNFHTKVTESDGKKRAVGGKERRLYTTHCAAYDAKNRHGLEDPLPMRYESIAHLFKASEKIATPAPKTTAPAEISRPCTEVQIQNIQHLWDRLEYGAQQKTKLFRWLEAESLEGVEEWTDLSESQAARAIGFLSKKVQEGAR